MRLVAIHQVTYGGVVVKRGEPFDADDRDVALLTRVLNAPARVANDDEEDAPKGKRRGRYRRSDLRSED